MLNINDTNGLSSDHNPLIVSFSTYLQENVQKHSIFNSKTDINSFQVYIERKVNLNSSLKSPMEIDEAVETFANLIHEAGFLSTPHLLPQRYENRFLITTDIRNLVTIKRRLRKIWQNSRNPIDKRSYNKAVKDLQKKLHEAKNEMIGSFVKSLNEENARHNEYKLWKATKYIKRPVKRNVPIKNINDQWCRSDEAKAEAFAVHLEEIFQSHEISDQSDGDIIAFLDSACPMDLPIKHISPSEVETEIIKLNNKKSPGYDGIDARVIKALPKKGILFLTLLYNSMLRLNYFPAQWKCAEIVMINKPNKPENVISSYRPISLLVVFSKIFEKIFLRRLMPILAKDNIIPEHQFGFREKHGTPEQCHRIVSFIRNTLETKKYCSGVFLDIQQAFDKVWHSGLCYKLKNILPTPFYLLLKSYLTERCFYVKQNESFSKICNINAGVPQGSVLGPILYTIFTSDMPTTDNVLIATYADDTAILASDYSKNNATNLVQTELNLIQSWLTKWKIKVNTNKSQHITFSLRKGSCPNVYLQNNLIPQTECVKYLGLHIDRRLTWKTHIRCKKQELTIKTKKLFWLLGPRSYLNLRNKILIYKTMLKPIWTYGIQLWGTASNSNIEILQRYQSKTLRLFVNAPWFVSNKTIHEDLNIPKVLDEITRFSNKYLERLSHHTNLLAIMLLDETEEVKRLKRHHILDLPFRN